KSVGYLLRNRLFDKQLHLSVRGNIALALGQLGVDSAALDLVKLLSNKRLRKLARVGIAKSLGQLKAKSAASQLIALLPNHQLDVQIRTSIAESLGQLISSEEEVSALFSLLPTSDIADTIFSILYVSTRRINVRILSRHRSEGAR